MVISIIISLEGYDVMIDLAITDKRGEGYYIGTASLYTGEFFCMLMTPKGDFTLVHKMTLREPSITTFFVKFVNNLFWSAGDDCNLNMINFI